MRTMSDFANHLPEFFERFGPVSLRRMFGGHGVYHDGRMFALVAGDRLYLKSDAQTVGDFEARRLAPFAFERQGKTMRTSYREAPPEVFEDRDEAAAWAQRAWSAVLRTPVPARAKKASAAAAPARGKRGGS